MLLLVMEAVCVTWYSSRLGRNPRLPAFNSGKPALVEY
jgi:hypothetical protein